MNKFKYLLIGFSLLFAACDQSPKSNNNTTSPPVVVQPETPPVLEPTQPEEYSPEEEEVDPDAIQQVPAEKPVVSQLSETAILLRTAAPKPTNTTTKPGTPINSGGGSYVRNNLRSQLTFNTKVLPSGWRTQVYTSHGYDVVKLPGIGNMARLELRYDDKNRDSKAVRAEINTLKGTPENQERIGYLLYFDSKYWKAKDSKYTIVTQFHNDRLPGEPTLSPPISLFVQDGLLQVSINYGNVRKPVQKRYVLGALPLDQVLEMYWLHNYSYSTSTDKNNPATGATLLSINGKRVLEHRGANKYTGHKENPYVKVGLYKRNWDKNTKVLVLYVGQLFQGNANSTWQDVSPNVKLNAANPLVK